MEPTNIVLFKKITTSSLLCLIIYFFGNALIAAFLSDTWIGCLFLSLLLMVVFSYLLLRSLYNKNDIGEKLFWQDWPKGVQYSLKEDFKKVFRREKHCLRMLCLINFLSWFVSFVDKLIFTSKTFSVIFLIYTPLNLISITLPDWLNSILGYIVGSVAVCAIYLLELVIIRNRWYRETLEVK